MKPFTITTPVLTLHESDSWFLHGSRCMLCHYRLAMYFEIGKHRKISLKLSSRVGKESIAFVFKISSGWLYPLWREKTSLGWNMFNEDADEWLLKNPPVCKLKVDEKMTVHVTVYLEA